MGKEKSILIRALIAAALFACLPFLLGYLWSLRGWQTFKITDAGNRQLFVVKSPYEYPSGATVKIHGTLSGSARIVITDRPDRVISGNVNKEDYFDFFSSEFEIGYVPDDGTTGELTLKVKVW